MKERKKEREPSMLLQVQIEIFWKINIIFKKGGGENVQFIEVVVKENSLS